MTDLTNIANFFPSSFLNNPNRPLGLGEEFSLCESGNMVFHWADFFETCDVIKTRMVEDEMLKLDFESRERGLQKLADIPVWIKTSSKVHQSNMYEIYEKFIMNQAQFIGGIDPFGPQDISFISGTGPFKNMAIAECFNQATYKDFVLVNLLKGKLPRRDFRIRLKSKVLMEHGDDLQGATLINLEQLTTSGLLLSLDSDSFLRTPSFRGRVRLILDTKCLSDSIGKGLSELSSHLSQYAFNLLYSSKKEDGIELNMSDVHVESSFDFLKNKKVYLFISYHTLKKSSPESARVLEEFVGYSKTLARDHYGLQVSRSA